jgi:hypothetical protein
MVRGTIGTARALHAERRGWVADGRSHHHRRAVRGRLAADARALAVGRVADRRDAAAVGVGRAGRVARVVSGPARGRRRRAIGVGEALGAGPGGQDAFRGRGRARRTRGAVDAAERWAARLGHAALVAPVHPAERRAAPTSAATIGRGRAAARDSDEEGRRQGADEARGFRCSYTEESIDHSRPSARTRPCVRTLRKCGAFA